MGGGRYVPFPDNVGTERLERGVEAPMGSGPSGKGAL